LMESELKKKSGLFVSTKNRAYGNLLAPEQRRNPILNVDRPVSAYFTTHSRPAPGSRTLKLVAELATEKGVP
jgi:hypothetical protein